MDWKDQILTWLPFILITDSLEDFRIDEALLEAKQEMEELEEDTLDNHYRLILLYGLYVPVHCD
jgi:hypothetical protein